MLLSRVNRPFAKCLAAAVALHVSGFVTAATVRPNVVFIITDDQGYGDLSCTGNPVLRTPAIDALHAESVRLTDYHVSPTCAPTRAALMAGVSSNRAGTWHTVTGRSLLREDMPTLGDMFAAGGYATGMFGKWHLGDNYPFRPEDRGFHEVVRHAGGGIGQTPDHWDNAYFDDVYLHNGRKKRFRGYCTDVFFREARRFIAASAARKAPFFAYIAPNAPHTPFHCPEEYLRPYLDRGLDPQQAAFFGMIAKIDEQVGKLRAELERLGIARDTVFIFTTDNGTAAGETVYNAGMRGKKASAYDGGHRVPFFLHWPGGGLDRPRDVARLTAHFDIAPTLLELCGLPPPALHSFEGRSLVPLLHDPGATWPERTIITDSQRIEIAVKWRGSAVMSERWRLVNQHELYAIQEDPGQLHDVAGQHPEIVQALVDAYEKWWAELEPGLARHARIRLGNDAENPVRLTGHDWYNGNRGLPWNQFLVRSAYPISGYWSVFVERSGWYEIELRRWPEESGGRIADGMPAGAPVPGDTAFRETPGARLPIVSASVEIGAIRETIAATARDAAVRFRVKLAAGAQSLRCEFHLDAPETRIIGAYYVAVTRL